MGAANATINTPPRRSNNNDRPGRTVVPEVKKPQEPALNTTCFSFGIVGYRTIKVSVELFLVLRILDLELGVSQAGLVYLQYTLADVGTGLILLKYPSAIFLGASSPILGLAYPLIASGALIGGFLGMFLSDQLVSMSAFGLLLGIGDATWFTYFQTVTNRASLTFTELQMETVAQRRQAFDFSGLLLPVICFAALAPSGAFGTKIGLTLVQQSAVAVGVVAALSLLVSSTGAASLAASLASPSNLNEEKQLDKATFWAALRKFLSSSLVGNILLVSIIGSSYTAVAANISLITHIIFGLLPTSFWIGAIGLPLGSIGNVVANNVGRWAQAPPRTTVMRGIWSFFILSVAIVSLHPFVPFGKSFVAMTCLFLFGLAVGFLYSGTYISALDLLFLRISCYQGPFASRASTLCDLGIKVIAACVFLLQTFLYEKIITDGEQNLQQSTTFSKLVEGLVFFAPLQALLFVACVLVTIGRDSVPVPDSASVGSKGSLASVLEESWCGVSLASDRSKQQREARTLQVAVRGK